MKQYVFDGSWIGLLTAVFEWFERRDGTVQLIHERYYQPEVFDTALVIRSHQEKAIRVTKGLYKYLNSAQCRTLYCTFLSEIPRCYDVLMQVLIRIFSGQPDALNNYGDAQALFIAQTAKSVEREKHRMKAFIRFEKSGDGLFFATAEPDFNVLPLITEFFRKRYADQPWLIYDVKRKYGLHFDTQKVSEVIIDTTVILPDLNTIAGTRYDEDELKYKTLWQQYFSSTNITARKNMKLHLQHVPKRYWKHLTEKQYALQNL
ncbi:MAG TPA: TIGR03915 family putative DNA repair protein [Flavipsychrobacter sp.]|nr:TIGR03915 family putative DNA repair protein [Flavipsychrobacter sp.]